MIEVARNVALPTELLWQVLSDLDGWASWLPTVEGIRAVEPGGPPEVGASYVVEQPGLPRATWTITDWRPGAGFTWESRAVGVRSTGRHELSRSGDGTTVRLSIEWAGPLAGLVRLLYGRKTERYVTREAEALEMATRDLIDRP